MDGAKLRYRTLDPAWNMKVLATTNSLNGMVEKLYPVSKAFMVGQRIDPYIKFFRLRAMIIVLILSPLLYFALLLAVNAWVMPHI